MPRAVLNPTYSTPASDWSKDNRTAQSWTYGGVAGTGSTGGAITPQQPTPSYGNLVYANLTPWPTAAAGSPLLPVSTATQGTLARDFPDIWYS